MTFNCSLHRIVEVTSCITRNIRRYLLVWCDCTPPHCLSTPGVNVPRNCTLYSSLPSLSDPPTPPLLVRHTYRHNLRKVRSTWVMYLEDISCSVDAHLPNLCDYHYLIMNRSNRSSDAIFLHPVPRSLPSPTEISLLQ